MADLYTTAGTVRSLELGLTGSKAILTITSHTDYSIKALDSKTRSNVFTATRGKVVLFDEDTAIEVADPELIRILVDAYGSSRLIVFFVDPKSPAKLLRVELPPKPSGS